MDELMNVQRGAPAGLVGCKHCPLDGKTKVKELDTIEGRKIFVWSPVPGMKEEERKENLVGSAGKLLWRELNREGVHRADCDVQTIVRCRPTDANDRDRIPTDTEARCCSAFTRSALKKSRARVHLVLGDFTARKLLGTEYRKDRVAFWSSKLSAHVVQTCHPNQLLRNAPIERRREFRRAMRAVAILQNCNGEFGILDFFDYREVKSARALKRYLSKLAASGDRVAVDIEDSRGFANRRDRLLCVAFCSEPGVARVVFLDHPERVLLKTEYEARVGVLREFLEDGSIEKIFHHGNHDVNGFRELVGINTKGYTYDTEYAAYLNDPNQRKYGLKYLSNNLVPEFSGYKDLPARYAKKREVAVIATAGNVRKWKEPDLEQVQKQKRVQPDYSTVPADLLGKYCCGDVDLSKRVEGLTEKDISLPLLQVFIHCGFMIDKMEGNGPHFDFAFYEQIKEHLPTMIRRLRMKIRDDTDRPAFNPGSHKQVGWLVYDRLGVPLTENRKKKPGIRETDSKILEQLKVKHPVLLSILEYRSLTKLQGTYLTGYHGSALRHNGHVRTRWWLTGTITGRLRSGGSDDDGIINLQNIASDPIAQNLLVSDRRWKVIQKELDRGESPARVLSAYGGVKVFLALDYCLVPDTKVLTSDLNWVFIKNVKVGDELIGFDEQFGNDNKFRRSVVEKVTRVKKPCYRITTDKGVVVASEHHRWVVNNLHHYQGYSKGRRKWVETKDIQKGQEIAYVCDTWRRDKSWGGGYLAGFFDGEGWVSKGSVGYGQKRGTVLDIVNKLLTKRGFCYSKAGYNSDNDVQQMALTADNKSYLRFIGSVRPFRLLKKASLLWEGRRTWGRQTVSAKVLKIEYVGEQIVCAVRTSTRTMIAEGMMSHNSGIEVRVLAEISGDPVLLALFNKGYDIHSLVGEELTGIQAAKIRTDKKIRVMIKGFHFGLMYGQSPEQMYENLKAQFTKMGIPKSDWPTLAALKEFQSKYFAKFHYVKKYIDRMHTKAERDGYVETMFGFRRPVWAGNEDDQRGTYWKNQAQNSPIQGSAHQLLLMCMAILHRKPKTYHLLQKLTLEIHDSIYFYVPLSQLAEAYKMAKELMEHEVARYIERFFDIKLRVPLVSEAEAGFRLGVMVADSDVNSEHPNLNPVEFLPKWVEANEESNVKLRKKYK